MECVDAGIITSLTQLGTGIPVVIQNNCVSQSSSTCDCVELAVIGAAMKSGGYPRR